MKVVLAHRERHRMVYTRCSCCWYDYIAIREQWKRKEPERLAREGLVMGEGGGWVGSGDGWED